MANFYAFLPPPPTDILLRLLLHQDFWPKNVIIFSDSHIIQSKFGENFMASFLPPPPTDILLRLLLHQDFWPQNVIIFSDSHIIQSKFGENFMASLCYAEIHTRIQVMYGPFIFNLKFCRNFDSDYHKNSC